uniref:Uncharacterized protein n=1 Tax=Panagrolaimus sp. JU765 TaxID=591449 RepID=A0AC34Q4I9_9BILA
MTDRRPPPLRSNPDNTVQNPTWTVTRRQRQEVSPIRVQGVPSNIIEPHHYQQRTITTTERVQIVQVPLDLNSDNPEAVLLSLSPTGTTSQHVESTTTTIEAGGVPIIGALTKDGVPIFNGIFMNSQQRQTTTIITTTTTTYRIFDDSSDTSEEFELVSDEEPTQLTIDMPLLIDEELAQRAEQEEFVIVDRHDTPRAEESVTTVMITDTVPQITSYPDLRAESQADTFITSEQSSPPHDILTSPETLPGEESPPSTDSPTERQYEIVRTPSTDVEGRRTLRRITAKH